MSNVNTLIKWPGGKAREIKYIEHFICFLIIFVFLLGFFSL